MFSLILACWRGFGLSLLLLLLATCQPQSPRTQPSESQLRARFAALLHAGDSVYAQKASYDSFAHALVYYDSAQALADRSGDTLLLANAVFAKGRIYDAWNKEPQQTIRYYQQAADLLRHQPGQRERYYHLRHLVAHAYDKVPDSLRTVQALRQLHRELRPLPDSVRRELGFIVEMALISSQVRNYALADTVLRQLTRRAWVRNDPATYDYLYHYYLTQARLEVLHHHRPASPYLDSLRQVYEHATNTFDRQYYSDNLAQLYAAARRHELAFNYLHLNQQITDSLNHGGGITDLRQALVESERRQEQAEARVRAARSRAIGGLSAALGIISLLSFYLYRQGRRSRAQSARLALVNQALDDKVAQVELLNKEIQHRVKNNLHMIFSLLQMQERRTDNEEVIEQLQAARLRVESIAALHNQLLSNPQGLDLGAYLKTLISTVVSCLANDKQVVTHLVTEELHLPTNNYFALSLILNEWVTNSIKYAGTADGLLEVSVRVKNKPGQVCIEYFDNGPAATLAAHGSSGLGSQIITLLSRQLGATLHTSPTNAYQYELCIPSANGV
ncbi:sensor histidine kinase [Hymenobacter sp. ASUV-10]|uniref:histidine kinase n=1 Tax=Hymenobacter aranciens TaxID=3063996 RepID=A0ABT9BEV0_9BACT|nr:sensor histidine kinase [Hymenobacter sp. ASUV-10]MDO7876798.1 sensor histidine kinase [Hymenobacter sp. ASUV-10]